MTDRKYIEIPNWDKFQHYKDRNPKWIKVYTELLDDPNYLGLNFNQRSLLHDLWMLYALARTYLPLDLPMINRRLGRVDKMATYESLNHAGFIKIVASRALAERKQDASLAYAPARSLEEDKEKEPPNPRRAGGSRSNGTNPRAIAKRERRKQSLTDYVLACINDDWPEQTLVDELTTVYQLATEEAYELIAQTKAGMAGRLAVDEHHEALRILSNS